MLARCARCQGTFQAERFGIQTCPHCGGELHLADPAAPAAGPDAAPSTPPPAAPPAAATPPAVTPPPQAFPPPWSGSSGPGQVPPRPPGGFGPPPGPFGGGARDPGGPGRPPPVPGELPSPFADRANVGFLRGFYSTWKLTAVEPANFFRKVRIDQTRSAILFGVIASTIGGWAQGFWTSLTAATTRTQMKELAGRMPPEWAALAKPFSDYADAATSSTSLMTQAVLAPLAALTGIFITSAIVHALLLLVRGANRGFNATLTVVGYAMGLSLLQVIPECGALVAPFWIAVVLIIGVSEAHRCGTGKGAAAVLLPIVLLCACVCAMAAMAIGAAGIGAVTGGVPKVF